MKLLIIFDLAQFIIMGTLHVNRIFNKSRMITLLKYPLEEAIVNSIAIAPYHLRS